MERFVGRLGIIGFAFVAWFAASPVLAATVTHTTVADFSGSGCFVGETVDGEVLLSPTESAEFFGSALPAGWASFDWGYYGAPSGSATVSGGLLTVDRARVNPEPIPGGTYGTGRSVEAVATFTAEPFQEIGFGAGNHSAPPDGGEIFNTYPFVIFSTGMAGTELRAIYGNGPLTEIDIDLGGSCLNGTCLGETHRYRIDWKTSTVEFFIDGVSVHAGSVTIAGPMRPAISDFVGGTSFDTDWLRMTPYSSPCDHNSAVIDGGNAAADWTTLMGTAGLPAGTAVSFKTRTGNVVPPDGSWSMFATVASGVIASPNARYLQYRARLSTTDPDQTPELQQVAVSYNPCTPTGSEVCDGIDNDCNNQTDEGTTGLPCGTGLPGICGPGTTLCSAGVLSCVPNVAPGSQPETCNGLDDDCDGAVDDGDPGGGASCSTGLPGICGPGTLHCIGGSVVCQQNQSAGPEVCNGLDDDCDGTADEGTSGGPCQVPGQQGVCANSTKVCVGGGTLTCPQTVFQGAETCNTLDDDCDGQVDEGTVCCGNGQLNPGEACDDNNTANGDCCSSICQLEPTFAPCDDGNSCTSYDYCESGVCKGVCQVGQLCGAGCAGHCTQIGGCNAVCSCQ